MILLPHSIPPLSASPNLHSRLYSVQTTVILSLAILPVTPIFVIWIHSRVNRAKQGKEPPTVSQFFPNKSASFLILGLDAEQEA